MASAHAAVPRPRSSASGRRRSPLVRVLLVGVLSLLGTGLVPPSTSVADEGSDAPGLEAPDAFRVAPHGGKPRPDREKRLLIRYDPGAVSGEAKRATLTMDVTGSSDVLRLEQYGSGCSGSDRKVVCRVGERYDSWTDWAGALPRAAPGSKPGDTGRLHVTFRDSEGKTSRATTRVDVGGPSLALRKQGTLRVGSGRQHAVALGVRNTGELPADGFAVTATVEEVLEPIRRSRTCDYRSHNGTTVTCRFPGVRIEPGEEARVEDWLVLRASRTAMYASFRATVTLLGSGADNGGLDGRSRSTAEPSPTGTPHTGTGAALAPEVGKASGGRKEYSGEKDVWTKVRIANRPDYAVVSEVFAVDDGRRLRVGLRNDGSGDPGGGAGVSLVLTLPKGTEVRKQPMEEIDEGAYEPRCRHHGLTYTCPLTAAAPGETSALDFEVRKGAGAENGKAKAALRIDDTKADHADPDTANNTRTFDLFGAPAKAAPEPGPGTGAVAVYVLGGGVVLAGAVVLVRRRVRGR